MRLAIICPCYNEHEVLDESARRLSLLLDELTTARKISADSYVLLVNDGSRDDTWEIIRSLHAADPRFRGLNLARNAGHQNAIMAGMMTVRGRCDAAVTIDVDLQDDLEALKRMIDKYREGTDIVYGVKRSRRGDSWMKRTTAESFYRLQHAMGVETVFNHADFRLMSGRALDELAQYGERNLYLRGIVPLLGLRTDTVDDVIGEREAGKSKYTLKKMANLAVDGITSFSVKPIHLIFGAGLFFLGVSVAMTIYILWSYFVHSVVPGWTSLMLSLWFIGSILLLAIGVIGEYIGKIYVEVKARPRYHIESLLGDDPTPPPPQKRRTMNRTLENWKNGAAALFRRPFWSSWRTLGALWLLLPVVAGLAKLTRCNNFLIYKYTFWHAWQGVSLYAPSPEYGDTNHYGPLFSLLAAPFAVLPQGLGLVSWCVALSASLFFAVRALPVERRAQVFLLWFCAHELLTALFMQQFNVATAALILATYAAVERRREGWAAFFIVVGTLVKLYGIVGLAFFFFVRRKGRFIAALAGWTALLFAAPMLISSPGYVVAQYGEWIASLTEKGSQNLFSLYQNVSLLGLVRKTSGSASYSDLWLIGGGLLLFALPYLRIGQYRHAPFRLALLASVLLFVVLFSTGSESSSYIIALAGVSIWYATAPWRRSGWDLALLIFAFVLTSLSPSDLFPRWLRQTYVLPYALKALPCILIWLKLVWEMSTREYGEKKAVS